MRMDPSVIGDRQWTVLVILGTSGTGKSTAAQSIARDHGVPWRQVDDLRLALQHSHVTLPERSNQLYFFERMEEVWLLPIEDLVRGFVDVAEVMAPAVRVVIDSHVATDVPLVLEGDGVLPELVDDSAIRPHVRAGRVRFCAVTAGNSDELFENMIGRGRGMDTGDVERHRRHADANAAFGSWLTERSREQGIPVVESRPFTTLPDRILAADRIVSLRS